MRLRANRAQVVRISAIDTVVDFVEGDEIRTEISRKFTRERFVADLASSGLELRDWFTDENERFALVLAAPQDQPASS
jgi:L-histidine N-alpha-methyltransferase